MLPGLRQGFGSFFECIGEGGDSSHTSAPYDKLTDVFFIMKKANNGILMRLCIPMSSLSFIP